MTEHRRPVHFATNAQMVTCILRAQQGESVIDDDFLDELRAGSRADFWSIDWHGSHFEIRCYDIIDAMKQIEQEDGVLHDRDD